MASIVFHPSRLCGSISAPPSKSEAHRALLLSAVADCDTLLESLITPFSDDIRATMNVCEMLGARLMPSARGLKIEPGKQNETCFCDVKSSAATFRMSLPILWSKNQSYSLRLNNDLSRRVLQGAYQLAQMNNTQLQEISSDGESTVISTKGKLTGNVFHVDGSISSQWISGMLIALSQNRKNRSPSRLYIDGLLHSRPYVEMTRQWMKRYALETRCLSSNCYEILSSVSHSPKKVRIPGDWTQAAVFLCAAAMGHPVFLQNLCHDENNIQGDESICGYLKKMGLKCRFCSNALYITNPSHARLNPLRADLSDNPDLFPPMSVLCSLCEGTSALKGASRLKQKECDRLAAILELLQHLGVRAEYLKQADELIIYGQKKLKGGFDIGSHGDHRMVMAGALAALETDQPIKIDNCQCITKSWPGFIEEYCRLGGNAQ